MTLTHYFIAHSLSKKCLFLPALVHLRFLAALGAVNCLTAVPVMHAANTILEPPSGLDQCRVCESPATEYSSNTACDVKPLYATLLFDSCYAPSTLYQSVLISNADKSLILRCISFLYYKHSTTILSALELWTSS